MRGDRRVCCRLTAAWNQLHRRAVCAHRHSLCRRRRIWRHNRGIQPACGSIAGHRGAAVATRIFENIGNTLLLQQREHDRRATVFERARRIEPFAFEVRLMNAEQSLDEWRAALSERGGRRTAKERMRHSQRLRTFLWICRRVMPGRRVNMLAAAPPDLITCHHTAALQGRAAGA